MLADAEMWQRARTSRHAEQFWSAGIAEAYERAMVIVTSRVRTQAADASPFYQERDYLRLMIGDADRVLATLRITHGKPVLISLEDLSAWLWTFYECAMDIASHVGLPWGTKRSADISDVPDEAQADHRIVSWLLEVVDALIDVADVPVWFEESDPAE